MQLLLIRHGRPDRVDAAGDTGADPGLTADGRDQAERLASFWARPQAKPITAIYASPMRRATQTAEPLAERLAVDLHHHEGLVEFDHGLATYIPSEEYAGDRRQQWQELLQGRWHGQQFDLHSFQRRVVDAIGSIVVDHPDPSEIVALVCHSGVINAYLADVIQTASPMFFLPDYTSITRVMVDGDGSRHLRSANDTAHLQVPRTEPTSRPETEFV